MRSAETLRTTAKIASIPLAGFLLLGASQCDTQDLDYPNCNEEDTKITRTFVGTDTGTFIIAKRELTIDDVILKFNPRDPSSLSVFADADREIIIEDEVVIFEDRKNGRTYRVDVIGAHEEYSDVIVVASCEFSSRT